MIKSEKKLYGSKGVVEYSAQSNVHDYTYMSTYDSMHWVKDTEFAVKTYVSANGNMQIKSDTNEEGYRPKWRCFLQIFCWIVKWLVGQSGTRKSEQQSKYSETWIR